MTAAQTHPLKDYIRHIIDYPKPGINFYDVTTLFAAPPALERALTEMSPMVTAQTPNKLVALESRGFILGACLARQLQLSLVLARKAGKLPANKISQSYSLEYGTATLEMHTDAINPGDRVVIVDDLIATGGSALAAAQLVERLDGQVVGITGLIGLVFLPFQQLLSAYEVQWLIEYA